MRTFTLLATFAALACVAYSETFHEIDINVDFTDEGKKLQHPTPKSPVYYMPLFEGYRELGNLVAGETKPSDGMVKALIAKTLAEQSYIPVVDGKHGSPTLLIVFYWGYMNPITITDPTGTSADIPMNSDQELALVAGKGIENLDLGMEHSAVIHASTQDRYFIVAQAFDFASAMKHKRKLMWAAKISTPTTRTTLDQVLPILAKAGGPLMGRETVRPKMILLPEIPAGTVDVGTPTVKDYQDVPQTSDAPKK